VSGLVWTTPRAWLDRHLRARLPGSEPRNPLQGRRILVTGASSGIGEATALACAARGATVLLVARRAEELERVRASVVGSGGTAYAYPCDLTDEHAVDRLVHTILREHGGVDMLVNNAGRSIRRSIALSYERMHDFERTMAINYFAAVRLMLGLLPAMVEQRFGHVVNIQTWGVQVKAPKFSAYIASKSALDTWSRIAGRELYGDGVTFTNVRMALVRTDMVWPTDAYRRAPAISPEQAAIKVVRALEDRPITVNVLAGSAAEVLNLLAPRLSDALFHRLGRRFPDSPAARAHAEESELQTPHRRVAARVTPRETG
jgi:NAD(P)-dependent dehydrogenase (short-subunit alcohol dehydrogenase family)